MCSDFNWMMVNRRMKQNLVFFPEVVLPSNWNTDEAFKGNKLRELKISGYSKSGIKISDNFVERLNKFYVLISTRQKLINGDQWSERSKDFQTYNVNLNKKSILSNLIHKKEMSLDIKKLLVDPIGSPLFAGFQSFLIDNKIEESSEAAQVYNIWQIRVILGLFLRLAEALGINPCWNPEEHEKNSFSGIFRYEIFEQILKNLDEIFNFSIQFPNPFNGEFGLITQRGIVSERVPHALYQAYKVLQFSKKSECKKIIEVGAGMGRNAYFCHLAGVQNYTLVDLPHVLIAQALFLGLSLGEESIWLYGEKKSDNQEHQIKLISPEIFFDENRLEFYDLMLNVDSLVEMPELTARKYIEFGLKNCRLLHSINQESYRFSVNQLLNAYVTKFDITRNPYWMRGGYIEETVKIA